jgi:hypothetical protein
MHWFADNSEMIGTRGATIPDILLFGGIIVPRQIEDDLRRAVEDYKRKKFGYNQVPVKWNFKDLKMVFDEKGASGLFASILQDSNTWRQELIELALRFDFQIVISCLESHSMERLIIKARKSDLAQYAFSNGLMRVASHARTTKPKSVMVTLDWPDKADSRPYDNEYASAYRIGKSSMGNVSYYAGPLKDLGFSDCVYYASMNHCTLLQISDLVLGATRELIDVALGKRAAGLGSKLCVVLKERYVGYPGKICGCGISISSKNNDTRSKIRAHLAAVLT